MTRADLGLIADLIPFPTDDADEQLPVGERQPKSVCVRCGGLSFLSKEGICVSGCRRRGQCTTGMSGAEAELLVAADLLRHGFYCFRSMSNDSPCDLLALKRGMNVVRVEVASGIVLPDGTRQLVEKPKTYEYDLLVTVFYDGLVNYQDRKGRNFRSKHGVRAQISRFPFSSVPTV